MNSIRRGIVALIKSAITGTRVSLPDGFDIEQAFSEIKRHNIVPLAYEGAVKCGISKTAPAMQEMFQIYCRQLMVSEGQLREIKRIIAAFDENGIDYLLLKGCNMKQLYPKHEMRVMGDADILIRTEQYEKIIPIMEKLGFEAKLESNHEYVWTSKQLFLELHKYLIPSYNKDYFSYFGDGWKLAVREDGGRHKLSVEDEYIYIFTHFAKHYRDGGIGCNHVTDLWVYKRAHPDMDKMYIEEELEKLQLFQFYRNIMRLTEVWFEDAEYDEKSAFITEVIFGSGSWGKAENHVLSAETKLAAEAGSVRGGKRKSLVNAVFPKAEAISQRYKVLGKAPWLLPVFWPVRWVDAALFRRDNIRKRQSERKFATEDKVEAYRKSREYVGLEFRFE